MDQDKIKIRLEKKLEGTDSEIFIPRMEHYCRGEKAVKIKPIFPGYTFVRTSIDPFELHKTVRDAAKETQIGIRELGFDKQEYHPCVSSEEEKLLDFLHR